MILKKIKFLLKSFIHPKQFYFSDGLFTVHNSSFKNDLNFKNAYEQGLSTNSWGGNSVDIKWRIHVILWAANQVKSLDGDFVECGVNKGGIAKSIISYIDFNKLNKNFWLFDTFEGVFNENLLTKEEKQKKYHFNFNYEKTYDIVKNTFINDNVKIIKGFVPETLTQFSSEKIAFLSLDLNSVKPELEALRYFYPKLSKGGIIVLDDFAYVNHEPQNEAITKLSKEMNFNILTLPTGQGVIVKS